MTKNRIVLRYMVLGSITLILGAFIYVCLRRTTYIAKFVCDIGFHIPEHKIHMLDNNFIKYYLPDYLWAFSFICWLYAILAPEREGKMYCIGIVFVLGILYEVFQCFNVISGTGDVFDVLMYILAGFSVNIISKKGD